MITVPLITGIIVLANPFINLILSDVFLPAAPVLVSLSFFVFLFCLNGPYDSLIRGMDKPSILAKIGIFMCLTVIVLDYLFIPKNGLLSIFGISGPTGAAFATVFSTLVGFFALRLYAKRLTGIKLLQSHTPRQIIASLIMGIILYLLAFRSSIFATIHWHHLLILVGIGIAIYFGLLYLLKEFNKKDLDFFLDILHPKKMMKYVSSELKEKPKKPV